MSPKSRLKTAMILAAGRGERLRPLTDHKPKALFSLLGQPLIAHHLHHLAQAGFEKVIINHAYLGGQIRRWVQQQNYPSLEIQFSAEPPGGLETGGGIVQALPLLGTEPFLILNADIYTDYDLGQLQLPAQHLAHAVLVNIPIYRQQGDYGLSSENRLTNTDRTYVFSGITCYHPDFFLQATIGRYSVTPMIREAVLKQQVSGEIYLGPWFDIGSAQQLALAEQVLMP